MDFARDEQDNETDQPSETGWARVDALTDATIDTSDIPPLTEDFFARATVRVPRHTEHSDFQECQS
jgi:hypothetical protein